MNRRKLRPGLDVTYTNIFCILKTVWSRGARICLAYTALLLLLLLLMVKLVPNMDNIFKEKLGKVHLIHGNIVTH